MKTSKRMQYPRIIRLGCYLFDRALLTLFTAIYIVLLWYALFQTWGDANGSIGFDSFPITYHIYVILGAFVIHILYMIILPSCTIGRKEKGQTVMKYLLHIKIVNQDTMGPIFMRQLLIRELLCPLFIEGSIYYTSIQVYFRDYLSIYSQFSFPQTLEWIYVFITISSIVFMLCCDPRHRMFHDVLARTCVISCDSEISKSAKDQIHRLKQQRQPHLYTIEVDEEN